MTATASRHGERHDRQPCCATPVKKERPAPVARTAPRRNAAGHDLGTVDLEPTRLRPRRPTAPCCTRW